MRFLLILLLILLIVPYLVRLLFPWLLRYMGKQMGKRMQRSFEENNRTKATGNTTKHSPPKRKKIDKNVGEYVEYEEIKE
ncbi:MAG: DUF4834 family protein [Prevotellaceae bacterium]|jgi:hypothetical protein|nr:DUF4834 family protein [Prevotellaceae bacterium]